MNSLSADANPVQTMFGRIAGVYDLLNHLLSFGIDKYWRAKLIELAAPANKGLTLDIASGTMDVAIKLAEKSACPVIAMDFCQPMLCRGLKKVARKNLGGLIFPCVCDALDLPCGDNTVESVTMAFGIRNIKDRTAAFQEMLRVLKPGGKACILEFGSGKEKIWGGLYNIYLNNILPQMGKIIGKDKKAYEYLAASIRSFPAADKLAREMAGAGLANTGWTRLTSGIVCLHWGEKPPG